MHRLRFRGVTSTETQRPRVIDRVGRAVGFCVHNPAANARAILNLGRSRRRSGFRRHHRDGLAALGGGERFIFNGVSTDAAAEQRRMAAASAGTGATAADHGGSANSDGVHLFVRGVCTVAATGFFRISITSVDKLRADAPHRSPEPTNGRPE